MKRILKFTEDILFPIGFLIVISFFFYNKCQPDNDDINQPFVKENEIEKKEVYISLFEYPQYNIQYMDGYKKFNFGDPISKFQNHLTPYYRDNQGVVLPFIPDPNGFYHFSPTDYNQVRIRYNMDQESEVWYRKLLDEDFNDFIYKIAYPSIRSFRHNINSNQKTYYYKDNESYTFLGHTVRDIILEFYDDKIEKIILIFPPPYNVERRSRKEDFIALLDNNPENDTYELSGHELTISLQNRFSHENRFSCDISDNKILGMYFYCRIYGFRSVNSNQVQNRGVSIILDSYKFYYNDKLQTGNIITLISDQRRYEEAVRLNNDL